MQYFCTDAPRWRRARRSSKSWVTRSNAKGRSDLQAAKTLIPRQQSCSRYATSDWCGLPAASSFPRHWRRCSDGQSGKYVRRRLDADGCRDQYHKRKPLQVTFSAVHRISCCNPPPSQLRNLFETTSKPSGRGRSSPSWRLSTERTARALLFTRKGGVRNFRILEWLKKERILQH